MCSCCLIYSVSFLPVVKSNEPCTSNVWFLERFDEKEQLIGVNNVKSSAQKAIRSKLTEQFPFIEDYLEKIIPKKDPLRIAKW